jgi:hypothetical protein
MCVNFVLLIQCNDKRRTAKRSRGAVPLAAIIVAAALLLTACASTPPNGAGAAAAEVRVFAPAQLVDGQVELVRRIWVDSWRTAFWVPSHSSKAAGIAALQSEAAHLGANGLVNVDCLDQGHFPWSWSREPTFICYGNAIRVH